jgi:hypothetical protein
MDRLKSKEHASNVNGVFDPETIRISEPASVSEMDASDFDPANLRLSQDLGTAMAVKKCLTTVPVRKPNKAAFVRVHPSDDYSLVAAIIELDGETKGELYLVSRQLLPALADETTLTARQLFTAIDRQGTLFLWPVRLPKPDGRIDNWSRTSLEAALLARTNWIRIKANMNLGAYETNLATAPIPDPEWPEESFSDLLRIAFRERFIKTMNDPVLKRLRGES